MAELISISKNTDGFILTDAYDKILVGEEEDEVLIYAENLYELTNILKN